ncbi:MAG: Crp/Fnr family transcriptional regulator [Desulfarculaceae bacterium]|nr:Crp/Fnr family transcriptional regulator [Desulfarculaceae bacterium]
MIFSEGDPANGFYIVETGKVKIFKLSFEGKEQILHIYGPGNPFGEVPVFEGKSFPAYATAIKDSNLIFLERDRFVKVLSQTPSLAMTMLGMLSRKLREFTVQIENLSLKEVPARLASYILTLSEEQENGGKVTLPLSKAQLANLIGTTPETLSRMLKKLSDEGFISVQAREISILDAEGLSDYSEA